MVVVTVMQGMKDMDGCAAILSVQFAKHLLCFTSYAILGSPLSEVGGILLFVISTMKK